MIEIKLVCDYCGKQSGPHELRHFTGHKKPPFYDIELDLPLIVREIGWVYEDNVCGDIYCSGRCSGGIQEVRP